MSIYYLQKLDAPLSKHDKLNRASPSIGVDLLVELQTYPEQYQLITYHEILCGEMNRSYLRHTLSLWNKTQAEKAKREEAKLSEDHPPFIRHDHSYVLDKTVIPKKSVASLEAELSELIKKYKIR